MSGRHMVLMGVTGCGKTSVGKALARRLDVDFIDGDDLHPASNVAKMSRGAALSDADRWPWLDRVGETMRQHGAPVIVGCSALRRVYRERIAGAAGAPVLFIHLSGSRAVIKARMAARTGHFMPVALLDSQFATLELPAPDEIAVSVDIDQPIAGIVEAIVARLATEHA